MSIKNQILLIIVFCLGIFKVNSFAQTFVDVSEAAGLPILSGLGISGVWIDYNNDNWPDILCSSSGQTYLFENNGDGTFTDVTSQSGLTGISFSTYSIADFDRDGWCDILVTTNSLELKILKNNGEVFQNFTTLNQAVTGAIWIDYNGDGWLDIFASRTLDGPLVYKNSGNNIFIDVSFQMNLPPNSGSSISAGDFNNDGFPDVYMGRYSGGNQLFKNIAGSDFENLPPTGGFSDFRHTVSVSWGDYNEDGLLDIYSANIGSNRNSLFENDGDETFTDVTLAANVPDVGDARMATFIDYNNDGYLDIFTTNHVNPNRLYKNNGDGTFTDVAVSSNISFPADGFGVSWGDYDNDGDLDVIIVSHTSRILNLLRNDGGNSKNWLFVKLEGSFDNQTGVNTRVQLFFEGRNVIKEINVGTGNGGMDALPLHFGVDTSTNIDSILVYWPSGLLQKVYNVLANQVLTITQQGNIPPAVFRLITPEDQTVIESDTISFNWTSSFDPDSNNQIQYTIFLKSENGDTLLQTSLTDTVITLPLKSIIPFGTTVLWNIVASDGISERVSWDAFTFSYEPVVSVENETKNAVKSFQLYNNYPNPFNPVTRIRFDIPYYSYLEVNIYNMLGQVIRSLVNEDLEPGSYETQWDGLTDNGSEVTSGIYFLKAIAYKENSMDEVYQKNIKMMLIK